MDEDTYWTYRVGKKLLPEESEREGKPTYQYGIIEAYYTNGKLKMISDFQELKGFDEYFNKVKHIDGYDSLRKTLDMMKVAFKSSVVNIDTFEKRIEKCRNKNEKK